MGADLITNSIMFPRRDGIKIIRREAKRIEAGLTKAKTIEDLEQLVSVDDYGNENGTDYSKDEGVAELKELIKADLEEVKKIKTFDDITGRDTSWHEFGVNDVQVLCLFAGEMTWGDSPEGYGYKILGCLSRLYIAATLHNSIPWRRGKKK